MTNMVKMVPEVTTVLFADILGFGARSRSPDAEGAVDALTDLAAVLSDREGPARYLNRGAPWDRRHALSDSLLLTAPDTGAAVRAAVELFFNLAYYNAGQAIPVMIRGALAHGPVRELPPLFPESARGNLAGSAVVEAVDLEKRGGRGPRLFVTSPVADRLAGSEVAWLLDRAGPGSLELLWVLPADPREVPAHQPLAIDVGRAAVDYFLDQSGDPDAGPHALAYLDLVARTVARLREVDAGAAGHLLAAIGLDRTGPVLDGLVRARGLPEVSTLDRVRALVG